MGTLFKTPDFNAYMQIRRDDFISKRKREKDYNEVEDRKQAARYFPFVLNNRNQPMKSGWVIWVERTGCYSWYKTKPVV